MQLNNLIVSITLFTLTIIPAYAETPTPYNEWDFDITKVDVNQNSFDLEELVISVTILYKGEFPEGTANIYTNVTDSEGYFHKLFGEVGDLSIGESQTVDLSSHIPIDGKYTIDVWLSPPEKPYLGHTFDTENTTYTIQPNGREKNVDIIGDDSKGMISYMLEDYNSVKYNEMVHAVITLPEQHTFEKIAVTNGKFVKELSIDTRDIYINSVAPFENLKVKLVKEGNLLPLADAQDTIQEYVVFYSNDKSLCEKVFCVNIDLVDEVEYPLWMLGFLAVIPVVYFVIKTRPKPFVSDPGKHVDERKTKQSKFSMKLNSIELGIPQVFKAKFERTEDE